MKRDDGWEGAAARAAATIEIEKYLLVEYLFCVVIRNIKMKSDEYHDIKNLIFHLER